MTQNREIWGVDSARDCALNILIEFDEHKMEHSRLGRTFSFGKKNKRHQHHISTYCEEVQRELSTLALVCENRNKWKKRRKKIEKKVKTAARQADKVPFPSQNRSSPLSFLV